ncbi:Lipid A export ATP-binding/permease protein MsbA [hydrothermal vent metagenome]|uniref:Lipid A export ATP-binding/permease protein MsbA n=1 Tax=hydrothermal vent metagenome TaxID=652676 RepID=A0A3B0SEU7_9ZZZZ
MTGVSRPGKQSELRAVLNKFRGATMAIILLSSALNILALTSSIYLLLIYDRVLTSGSIQTLVSLFLMIAFLFIFQGLFEILRSNLLAMLGHSFDRKIATRVQKLEMELAVTNKDTALPMRDLDQIRGFMAGPGPSAMIDLPWILFFLIILFLLHPLLGLTTLVGAIVMGILTWTNDKRSVEKVTRLTEISRERAAVAQRFRRNAETIKGLGISKRVNHLIAAKHDEYVTAQSDLSRQTSFFGTLSKVFRIFLQSAVLTVGAVIVLNGQATGGIIFASAILAGRALAPVDQAIANWRNFVGARQGWHRLNALLAENPDEQSMSVELAAPHESISAERIMIAPPGSQRIAVAEAQFKLRAGDAAAIVGPSGSGKSSLVRGLVNVWPLARGAVRLDGAELEQWDPDRLGEFYGYVPQEIELFSGTVAENIARFEPDAPSGLVTAAAKQAGLHDLILHLPEGYETQVGEGGTVLSTGQRQRVALARALYRDPFIVILDEPDSNLDPEGEAALIEAINNVRERNGIVIIVTHRMPLLKHTNIVMVMNQGKQTAFGPRDQILDALNKQRENSASAKTDTVQSGLKVVSGKDR